MFLHLGADTVIRTDTILGVFDLDTTTVSRHSRDYLNRAEKSGRVVNVSPFELPKSFVVCEENVSGLKDDSEFEGTLTKVENSERMKEKQTNNSKNTNLVIYLSQLSPATLLKRLESGQLS